MLLDPINSLSSFDFYKKVAAQSLGRSFLYLAYLGVVFSLFVTLAVKLRIGPIIDETFDWLSKTVPTMTYAEGRMSSSASGPVKLVHPKLPEIAFIVDTTRVDPVSPAELAEAKVTAFMTAKAFYLRHRSGKVEVYDLSKGSADKPVTIDAAFFQTAGRILSRVLYPLTFAITVVLFFFWKFAATLIYSLLALILNVTAKSGLEYGALFNMTVYAQTAVILLQCVAMLLPFSIPFFTPLALAVTGVYLWLALKQFAPSSQPA